MEDPVVREWDKLTYKDPEKILIGLREISRSLPLEKFDYHVASFRTRPLRKYGEGRQAALFCYAMGKVAGTSVYFAQTENRDHDIVAKYLKNEVLYFVPVQLKELVPDFLNPRATLQRELDKLSKYVDGRDLVVAIHVNRRITGRLSELTLPRGKIGQLWLYGAIDDSQGRWCAVGDLLSGEAVTYEFSYPGAV